MKIVEEKIEVVDVEREISGKRLDFYALRRKKFSATLRYRSFDSTFRFSGSTRARDYARVGSTRARRQHSIRLPLNVSHVFSTHLEEAP